MGIGWKKGPILWQKYGYQFLRLFHSMGFAAFSLVMGNSWVKMAEVHMPNYELYRENVTRYEPIVSVMLSKRNKKLQ